MKSEFDLKKYVFTIPESEIDAMWDFAQGRLINLCVFTDSIYSSYACYAYEGIMNEENYLLLKLSVNGIRAI